MKDEFRELVRENRSLREKSFELALDLNCLKDNYEALLHEWDKLISEKTKKPKKKAKKKRA